MGNYIPPADKATGSIFDGPGDFNPFKNGLADFLNGGNLGNSNFSSSPAERLVGSKVDLGGGVTSDAHHTRHEPGGADMVRDIKLANGAQENVSAHAARHADGGVDALLPQSVSQAMLKPGAISAAVITERRDSSAFLKNQFGLSAYIDRSKISFNLTNANAGLRGNGVIRSGKVYFAAQAIDLVVQFDPTTSTFTNITLAAGDAPNSLCMIGTDIYVCCAGDGASIKPTIKKIDVNNAVTTICNITTDGAAKIPGATVIREITPNLDGSAVYITVNAGGGTEHILARVSTTPSTGVTHNYDTATHALRGPAYVKVGTSEYVVILDTTDGNVRRRNAADLSAVDAVVALSSNPALSSCAVWDGAFYVISDRGTTPAIRVWDVTSGSMNEVLNVAVPANSPSGGTPPAQQNNAPFFDGRSSYFVADSSVATIIVVPAGRYGGAFNARVNDTTTHQVRGFATDGTELWASGNDSGSNTEAKITRLCIG